VTRIIIGMPVYNGERFLGQAIESILAQTFRDFEIFISDNASTDGTEQICRSFAHHDPRVHYVRQSRNIGAIGNFNAVTRLGRAEYFKWAAHDDLLAPTFLEQCVQALDQDAGLVLASPGTQLIDEQGAPLPYSAERGGMIDSNGVCWPVMPEANGDLVSPDPARRFEAVILHTNLCVEIFGLIRWSALADVPPQGAFLGSDKVMIAELALRGRFWMGKEPLFLRRCHDEQFSAQIMRVDSGDLRAEWFSGSRQKQLSHHIIVEKVVLLKQFLRAVWKAPIPISTRLRCLTPIARRAVSRKVWSLLSAPVVALLRSPLRRARKPAQGSDADVGSAVSP
jgi:glycosyltransferase involved in cell wall biosynthesis